MSGGAHNLGRLRMAVEDLLVAYLAGRCDGVRVRAAYTTQAVEHPLIVVHAKATREVNDAVTLARYVDVEVRALTHAEDSSDDGLRTAREAHSRLVGDIYEEMADADIVTALTALGGERVSVWSCYALTDEGSVSESSYLTQVQVEIGATPKGVGE